MKKIVILLMLSFSIAACGSTSGDTNEEMTPEQEAEIVDSISSDIDQSQQDLKSQTDENLTEIDSLLQNLE